MLCCEPHVAPGSYIYRHSPSPGAREGLLYLCYTGSYVYEPGYDLVREDFDCYLLEVVLEGSITFEAEGGVHTARQDDVVLIDCHNAQEHSFLICSGNVSEERVAQQQRFNELVCTLCDFGEIGRVKFSQVDKYANFKQYAMQNFGFGLTMELSRFGLYDREQNANPPLCRESFLRLGSQLPHAIDAFLSEE